MKQYNIVVPDRSFLMNLGGHIQTYVFDRRGGIWPPYSYSEAARVIGETEPLFTPDLQNLLVFAASTHQNWANDKVYFENGWTFPMPAWRLLDIKRRNNQRDLPLTLKELFYRFREQYGFPKHIQGDPNLLALDLLLCRHF